MGTPVIDYDALAKKFGATSSAVDYDALAKKFGAVSSEQSGMASTIAKLKAQNDLGETQFEKENSIEGQRARAINPLNALSNVRQQAKVAAEEYRGLADQEVNRGKYNPVSDFALRANSDLMGMVAGATEPKNIALGVGTALVPEVALPVAAYMGAESALTPQQAGETDADAIQRRLMGASQVAGSFAGATAQPQTLTGRLVRTDFAQKTARRMYQSALKPPTGKNTASRNQQAIETGLREGIPVSEKGLAKLTDTLDNLNAKVEQVINTNPGAPISKFNVSGRLGNTQQRFANQVAPGSDLGAINDVGAEFYGSQPANIPAAQAQALKQGTYKAIGSRNYGEVKAARVEAEKALARGLKEELEVQFPEIKGLNAKEARLYSLEPLLQRALGRISNHELLGIGTPIAGGTAAAVTGSSKVGAALGALKAIVDNPAVKSRLAIMIARRSGGKLSLKAAHARVAGYVNAVNATELKEETE